MKTNNVKLVLSACISIFLYSHNSMAEKVSLSCYHNFGDSITAGFFADLKLTQITRETGTISPSMMSIDIRPGQTQIPLGRAGTATDEKITYVSSATILSGNATIEVEPLNPDHFEYDTVIGSMKITKGSLIGKIIKKNNNESILEYSGSLTFDQTTLKCKQNCNEIERDNFYKTNIAKVDFKLNHGSSHFTSSKNEQVTVICQGEIIVSQQN